MTSGIHHHNGVVVYVRSDGKKVRTSGCTAKRVNIMGKSGSYCRQCYCMQPKEMKADAKKNCKTSTMGCFFVVNLFVRNAGMSLGMISIKLIF